MALTPLDIPAGIYRNGTELQSSNRWRDANLVRWVDNTMRPVGGWRVKSDNAADYPIRGMVSWKDNDGARRIAGGSYNSLYVWNQSGIRYDITPTGFVPGRESATGYTGYSAGAFGLYAYGVERLDNQTILPATTWALENWGEYLLACTQDDGKIYEWQLDNAVPATLLSNAPVDNISILVTEERFVFALGAGGNRRLVQWSDKENNNLWVPSATNEAGDLELQTNGEIMCGIRVRGQSLIITTKDAHAASYQGPPYVYGIERVGTSCGIISQKAAANTDIGAVWMGLRSFFVYSGGSVSKMRSDVSDYVFSDINVSQQSKVFAVTNSRFGEVWWFYPSGDSTECNRYVVYNFIENNWTIGSLSRTSGVDSGTFRNPIWASADNYKIYEHEAGLNYDGLSPFAESGPIMIGVGDQVASVVQMIPDERTAGQVSATFKTRFYPNDEEREYGPYQMASPTSLRFTGRQLRIRVEGEVLSDWRVGINRLDIVAGGRR